MNTNEMLNCEECSFGLLPDKQKPCNMCGVERGAKLETSLKLLCEQNEQIVVSMLNISFLQINYVKDQNFGNSIILSAHKNDLTDDKIENAAIDLITRFRELIKDE